MIWAFYVVSYSMFTILYRIVTDKKSSSYLLTYDPLQFHSYLETLIATNTITPTGGTKQHQSPWMLTDAANIIFQAAQRRCYIVSSAPRKNPVIDLTEDDDAWAALDEAEGIVGSSWDKGKAKETYSRPSWLSEGIDPVLEELPKWNLLAEIILEAEVEMIRQEGLKKPEAACTSENFMLNFKKFHLHSSAALRIQYDSCHDIINTDLQLVD